MADATRPTGTTRPGATEPARQDGTVVVTTVAHAAEILGISPGAVRKRIERGHLGGRKVDGQWRVLLNRDDTTRQDASDATGATEPGSSSRDRPDHAHETGRVVSAAAQAQLDAFRDAILRPHLERIEALAKDVGQLTAERDSARVARDHAIRERVRAEQRLASDRVLIDLAIAEADRPRPAEPSSAFPTRRPAITRRSVARYVAQIASLVTILAYVGLTVDEIEGSAHGAYLSFSRLWHAAGVGIVVAGIFGLLMGQLYRWYVGPPPTFRELLADPLGRKVPSRGGTADSPTHPSDN